MYPRLAYWSLAVTDVEKVLDKNEKRSKADLRIFIGTRCLASDTPEKINLILGSKLF